jgi:hypothetical protein
VRSIGAGLRLEVRAPPTGPVCLAELFTPAASMPTPSRCLPTEIPAYRAPRPLRRPVRPPRRLRDRRRLRRRFPRLGHGNGRLPARSLRRDRRACLLRRRRRDHVRPRGH